MRTLTTTLSAVALTLAVAGNAQAVPLSDLLAGGSLIAGDKLFEDWTVLFVDSSDPARTVNTANIEVTALDDGGLDPGPGLQFDILNGELDVTGDGVFAYVDFTFGFSVSVLDPSLRIKDNSLELTGGLLASITEDLGFAIVEDVFDAAGDLLGTKEVYFTEGVSSADQIFDSAEFAPQSQIAVTKNILVWATAPNEAASLTQFTQRFSQTTIPEPATLTLLGLGLAGLGFARARRAKAA